MSNDTPMAVYQEQNADTYRLTVRANCALTWRTTKVVILSFTGCLAAVAGYFASLGAWLVLPFAGLELAVVVGGFYVSALAGHTREVVEIRGRELRVLRGRRRLFEVAALSPHWTRVALVRDPGGWHPSRLLLRSHGATVELQTRLVEAEREAVARELSARLGLPGQLPPTPAAVGRVRVGLPEGEAGAMVRVGLRDRD